nr:tetraketide alpha-pyrone reductase 2 [Tanacetum cinerariifolium]
MSGRHRMPRGPRDGPMPVIHRGPPGPLPPHPAVLEEELELQHHDIQRIATENRHVVEENVAIQRELTGVKDEIHSLGHIIPKLHADRDARARDLTDRGMKLEAELRKAEPLRADVSHLRGEAQKLNSLRQDLSDQLQTFTKDTNRLRVENEQVIVVQTDIDGMRKDLVEMRRDYEMLKKTNEGHMIQKEAMEKNLISMAREIEKLRGEQMRTRGLGGGGYGMVSGSPGGGYGDVYGGGWGSYDHRGPPRKNCSWDKRGNIARLDHVVITLASRDRGGTGFIAGYLIKSLLEKGHAVRTTVRDPENVEKVGYLLELKGAQDRLQLIKADLMEEGSFDEAIDGVDGVFHTASPVVVPYDHNIQETLIDPCIKGTMNVLTSCKKAKSLKRVVLTSSCSSIRYRYDTQQVSPLNESHWSDTEYCKQHNLWYAYAKTIAEEDAWNVAKESGIDLVVVNPSYVVGPLLAPQPTSTLQMILAYVIGAVDEYPNTTVGFVHIDDVVAGHIIAMENKEASGRLICSSTVAHWTEVIHMLKSKYPSYPYIDKCSTRKGDDNPHSMDSSKIIQLGLPPLKSLEKMFDDCIKSFQEKGFL